MTAGQNGCAGARREEKRKAGHDRDGAEQGATVGALSHDTAMRQKVLTMRLSVCVDEHDSGSATSGNA